MWNIEKDPWLNPSGAALTVLDRPVDVEHFRQTMRVAVAGMPRLFERVVPGIGRLATPVWAPDAEFDLDYHVRFLRLPSRGPSVSCSTSRRTCTSNRSTAPARSGDSS